MNNNLFNIVKKIISEQGENILNDPKRLKPIVSDYASEEPKEDRVAFGRAIEQGFYSELKKTSPNNRSQIKASMVQRLIAITGFDAKRCASAIDLLDAVISPSAAPKTQNTNVSGSSGTDSQKPQISKRTLLFAIAAFAGAFTGSFVYIQSGLGDNSWNQIVSDGIWSGFTGFGIAIGLVNVQTFYLKKKFYFLSILKYALIGFITGAAGWILGVLLCILIALNFNISEIFFKVICWGIFGFGLGLGVSFYVTNFPKKRAMLAGLIGGLFGGLISYFLPFSSLVGVWLGDAFVGFAIGLMISIVEETLRQAWITVIWGPKETRTIALGQKPVLFGSTQDVDVYLPQTSSSSKNLPVSAVISIENGLVIFEDKVNNRRNIVKNGDKVAIGKLQVEISTK